VPLQPMLQWRHYVFALYVTASVHLYCLSHLPSRNNNISFALHE